MIKHAAQTVLAGALLAVGSVAALPGVASASRSPRNFAQAQQKLEQQLTSRVSQLSRLSADVSGSTTLTSEHATILGARLAMETANIQALVVKVPTDTTMAELTVDRMAMLQNNRVFAVETPQVIEVIEADAIAAQVTSLQAAETSLQASVNSLSGQPGFDNAQRHYSQFAMEVNTASTDVTNAITSVIAQVPSNFPGDTSVFVSANHALLNATIALAHASYDETIIGLASGGYNGS